MLVHLSKQHYGRNRVTYWMDLGNSRTSGQVILSTLDTIRQPASELYRTVEKLPMPTREFKEFLSVSD